MKEGTIKVRVGSVTTGSGGITQDLTREVEFEGKQLAQLTEFGTHEGNVTDTRGTVETLYQADDGRLIAHVRDWSNWQGEPTIYSLHEVTEADLQVGGKWESIGAEAGYGRALSLDEGLTR